MTNERLQGQGSTSRPSSQPPTTDTGNGRKASRRPRPPTPTVVLNKDRGAESQAGIGDQGASQNLTTHTQPDDTLEDADGKRGSTEGQFRRDLNVPIRILQ